MRGVFFLVLSLKLVVSGKMWSGGQVKGPVNIISGPSSLKVLLV